MDKWWWLDWPYSHWSREEQDAVSQLGLTAAGIFILLTVPQFIFVRKYLGHSFILFSILGLLTLFVSLFLTRPICAALWPGVIKAGDAKAATRLAERDSTN